MTPTERLTQALCPHGRPAPINEIRITIVDHRFRWSLWRDGLEVFAGFGAADQVAGMTRTTAELVDQQLLRDPLPPRLLRPPPAL